MLALRFHARDLRYLLDARRVVEIVPQVELRPAPGAPEAVVGVLDYRGLIVPVLDLCRYVGKGECAKRLSSRIIVLDVSLPQAGRHGDHASGTLLGLLAERVLEVERVDEAPDGAWEPPVDEAHEALGEIRPGEVTEQLVRIEALIEPGLLHELARAAAAPDGAEA